MYDMTLFMQASFKSVSTGSITFAFKSIISIIVVSFRSDLREETVLLAVGPSDSNYIFEISMALNIYANAFDIPVIIKPFNASLHIDWRF